LKHEGATRAHPDNSEMKVQNFFPCFARNNWYYTPLCYYLWQRHPPTATGPFQISWLWMGPVMLSVSRYVCTV